jgi:hypothetical protein
MRVLASSCQFLLTVSMPVHPCLFVLPALVPSMFMVLYFSNQMALWTSPWMLLRGQVRAMPQI